MVQKPLKYLVIPLLVAVLCISSINIINASPGEAGPVPPFTVTGQIYVEDGTAASYANVTVTNLDTGDSGSDEVKPGDDGWYQVDFKVSEVGELEGDTIKVTATDSQGRLGTNSSTASTGILKINVTLEGNGCPDAPELVKPDDGAENLSVEADLSVDVSDPDGDPMDVTFYNASDGSTIGSESGVASGNTATVTWSSLSYNTTYCWYAVADDGACTTRSATWTFTTTPEPQHPPDEPSNPSPVDGATITDNTPSLSVDVSDPDGDSMDVEFYVDGSSVGTDTGVASGKTASVSINVSDGFHGWYAVADDGSNTTQSPPWDFTLDTTVPTGTIDAIADGANPSSITGSASDSTSSVSSCSIEIYDSTDGDYWTGSSWGSQRWLDCSGTTSWSYSGISSSDWDNGHSITVTLKTTDSPGNTDSNADTESFTTNNAPDAPTNPSPSDGSTVTDSTPTLSVDVSDPDGDWMDVTFYVDGSSEGTDPGVSDGGTATITTGTLNDGSHDWYAEADDGTDITSSSTWSFTVDTTPPSGSIDAVSDGTNPSSITGSASDVNGGSSVSSVDIEIYDSTDGDYWTGTGWGAATWLDCSGTTSWSYDSSDVNWNSGHSITVTVRVYDGAGNIDRSADTESFITNMAPDAPGNPSPSDGATGVSTSPTLSVAVSDPDDDAMDVTFYNASDSSSIATNSSVDSGGIASVEWNNLSSNTTYRWYAVADDGDSSNQSATWMFTTRNESVPDTDLEMGQPIHGDWITTNTNISLTIDNTQHLNATYYRLWHDGSWHPLDTGYGVFQNFSLFKGNITLSQFSWADEGQYYIEYYSDTTYGVAETIHNSTLWADISPPTSQVSLSSYLTSENMTIPVTTEDSGCGVANISLYYRYCQDNDLWGGREWQKVDTYSTSEGAYIFSFPDGVGYYQFATRSTDNLGHREPMPALPGASCRFFSPDINQDGRVDVLDFVCISSHWMEAPGTGTHHLDLNGDGRIDLLDLVLLSDCWA